MQAKTIEFNQELQQVAKFAKVLSHPARIAILVHLAQTKTCISGDIAEVLPLSRTTVSQHLQELKSAGLIKGTIDGLKVNYCLNMDVINENKTAFDTLFNDMLSVINCDC